MPPSAGKYLRDILDAARLAVSFVDGKSFADYESDILIRSAVERQLTILCEAMSQLDHHHQELTTEITDHDAIIGMRIVLVHRYADLDNRRVWDTVSLSLPVLIQEVGHLLENL
ncbi:MAG: DUF86 domain-containing protein [Chloroflexi bacterium]|nr:DUF86 domain-containing protein [Chloroflexota bacterium]